MTDDLDQLVNSIVNREIPDRGQHISNVQMFGHILRYTNQTEMQVLEEVDYAFMYGNGRDEEFDTVAQMIAFLQMTCFSEIIQSKCAHSIWNINVRLVNAELWYKKFRSRIDPKQKFYIH